MLLAPCSPGTPRMRCKKTFLSICRAFDSLAPARSPFGLPVYVARRPAAPFFETPVQNETASDTDALQHLSLPRSPSLLRRSPTAASSIRDRRYKRKVVAFDTTARNTGILPVLSTGIPAWSGSKLEAHSTGQPGRLSYDKTPGGFLLPAPILGGASRLWRYLILITNVMP